MLPPPVRAVTRAAAGGGGLPVDRPACHRHWLGPSRAPPPVGAVLCAVATEGRWASATASSAATAAPREEERGRHQREREREVGE